MFFFLLWEQLEKMLEVKKQYLVDYTYQYEFAKMASENRVSHYSLVSSVGANNKSYFFILELNSLEESIKYLNFNKSIFFNHLFN